MFREGRQVHKRRRRDLNKYEKLLSSFIDFSSIFRLEIDPGTLARTNRRKNKKTRLEILVFLALEHFLALRENPSDSRGLQKGAFFLLRGTPGGRYPQLWGDTSTPEGSREPF